MNLDGIQSAIEARYHKTKRVRVDKSRDHFIVTVDSEKVAKDIAELIKPQYPQHKVAQREYL